MKCLTVILRCLSLTQLKLLHNLYFKSSDTLWTRFLPLKKALFRIEHKECGLTLHLFQSNSQRYIYLPTCLCDDQSRWTTHSRPKDAMLTEKAMVKPCWVEASHRLPSRWWGEADNSDQFFGLWQDPLTDLRSSSIFIQYTIYCRAEKESYLGKRSITSFSS